LPAETREKILQAAFRTLSRKGYENTTVKDIAEEAGVAPGLLHYYFKSKQALVLAVLVVCCAKMQQPHAIDSTPGVLEAFEYFKAALRSERDSNQLYVELLGVGLHDPEVGAGVLEFVRQDRGNIEAIARDVLAARELPTLMAPALAAAVWGGTLGIMIQHLVDPEFDADAAVDALAAMAIATVTRQPDLT
jgi:AcrR family transcriptional regulator